MKGVNVYEQVEQPLENIRVEVTKEAQDRIYCLINSVVPLDCISCGIGICFNLSNLVTGIVEIIEEEE